MFLYTICSMKQLSSSLFNFESKCPSWVNSIKCEPTNTKSWLCKYWDLLEWTYNPETTLGTSVLLAQQTKQNWETCVSLSKSRKQMNCQKPEDTSAQVFVRPWCGFIIKVIQKNKIEDSKEKETHIVIRMSQCLWCLSHLDESSTLVSWESLR